MTNYTKAIEILKSGNEDAAWKVARMDSGLAISCTKEKWLDFAYKAIENRNREELANSHFSSRA